MQVFAIAPAAMKGFVVLWGVVGLALSIALGAVALATSGARTARFEISSDGLRLRGDLYGRLIPIDALRIDQARRVELDATSELAPRRRTMGTGLPGYQAGWFRLRNGEKALVYLTDRSRAVYVPTTAGYDVLLSPEDPDGFLRALASLRR
jgi:PH (Pleckstrin Homology) domain-containing protein